MASELQQSGSWKKHWEIQTMVRLDLRNMISPFTLLKASNAFRSLARGDELEILCNDPESLTDLIKIIPSDSCELVSMKDLSGKHSGLKARLRKRNP